MAQAALVTVTGNTFPVKDAIKALSPKVRWNAAAKGWDVPAAHAEAARALIAGAQRATDARSSNRARSGGYFAESAEQRCRECGARASGCSMGARGFSGGYCYDCQ